MISKQNHKVTVQTATWLSKQKLNLLLFFLFVVLLPTQFGYHFWPNWSLVSGLRVDYLAPTITVIDIIALLLLSLYFFKNGLSLKLKLQRKRTLILIACLLFVVLNIVLSLNFKIAIYKWIKLLEFGLIGFWVYKNKELVVGYISVPLIIGLTFSLILGLTQFISGKTVGGLFYFLGERSFNLSTPGIALVNIFGSNHLRPYAAFSHPNVLAGFSLVGLFLVLEFEKRKMLRWFGAAVATLNILLSFSLGAAVALAISSTVYWLKLYKPLSHIYKQIILSFLLVSIVLMPVAQYMVSSGSSFSESITKRLELATVAGEAFSTSSVFGVGAGNFISYIPSSSVQKNLWFLQPVHNIFLLVLTETGVVGVSLFVYLLFRLKISQNPQRLLLILPILITGLFDHYWLTLNPTTFLFALVVGILF